MINNVAECSGNNTEKSVKMIKGHTNLKGLLMQSVNTVGGTN